MNQPTPTDIIADVGDMDSLCANLVYEALLDAGYRIMHAADDAETPGLPSDSPVAARSSQGRTDDTPKPPRALQAPDPELEALLDESDLLLEFPCIPMEAHRYGGAVMMSNPPQVRCVVCGWHIVLSDPPRQYNPKAP